MMRGRISASRQHSVADVQQLLLLLLLTPCDGSGDDDVVSRIQNINGDHSALATMHHGDKFNGTSNYTCNMPICMRQNNHVWR